MKPVNEIVEQLKQNKDKFWYFIDDNFGSDIARAKEILIGIIPLKKMFFAQISVNYLQDEEFVRLLHQAG